MSKEKINVTNAVMGRIRNGSVRMKPKIYFVMGSLLMMAGLVASFVVSVFLIAITRFSLRTHGPMGEYRLSELWNSFPWWAPVLAVVGIVFGIALLRKYEFSYKRNYYLLVAGFILAVLLSVITIDRLGLGDVWFRQGPMRGIMRRYIQKDSLRPGRMMRQRGNGFGSVME